ncbi:MAG: hypothetical protein C4293_17335 [Nitrospiraceae bacterium]
MHIEPRTVDVHIAKLRHTLKAYGRRLETVWGIGYRFRSS